MSPNILISGLGGSLFPYLHNKLKNNYNLFYIDSDESLCKLYTDLNFYPAPKISNQNYKTFIESLIKKFNIEYYIPLIDEEIVLAKKDLEGLNGLKVIAPSAQFSKLCLNKFTLMKELQSTSISFIDSYIGNEFNWDLNPPIFVKPVSGRGSRGIQKINEVEQLNAYYKLNTYLPSEILIQPFIEGTEYTVGVTTNNFNNILAISSKKIINKRGITQKAITENNLAIEEVVFKVVEQFKPCGPFNIQLIITPNNEVKIFEINPRFSTTTIMEYEGGIDLVDLYIKNLNKEFNGNISRPKAGLMLHRRWDNIFYHA